MRKNRLLRIDDISCKENRAVRSIIEDAQERMIDTHYNRRSERATGHHNCSGRRGLRSFFIDGQCRLVQHLGDKKPLADQGELGIRMEGLFDPQLVHRLV